ncbi:DUF4376 domain-containing protein [Gilvimarinus agarilyticus]|uniref:DUF4376 domain-containing protein n=1 Tax=Gilvimarinus agarilyticus TaxID=679259 RepID=UPI00059F51D9|nr:hypothetical protein [Gilvimarinus agarilyticus]
MAIFFLDRETEDTLEERDVKARLMAAPETVEDIVTPPAPSVDVVEGIEGETPEVEPEPPVEPVPRVRTKTRIINRLNAVSNEDLESVGVVRVLEVAPPVLEAWQSHVAGALDKTDPNLWAQTWVVTGPSVAEAVAKRKAAIEYERDILINDESATVTLSDGRIFQTDPRSVTLMNRAKSNADLNGGFAPGAIWRDADNVNHPRTTALFAEISAKEEARCEPIWLLSWVLKDQVDTIAADAALTDAEKVAAIMAQTWAAPEPE